MIFYITLTGPKDNNQSVQEVSLQKRGGTQWGNESENQRIKCNWLDSQVINLLSKCWTAYAWNVISQLTSQLGCHAVHLCCQNYERQYFAPSYHCRTTVTQGTHVFLINNLWTCAKPLFYWPLTTEVTIPWVNHFQSHYLGCHEILRALWLLEPKTSCHWILTCLYWHCTLVTPKSYRMWHSHIVSGNCKTKIIMYVQESSNHNYYSCECIILGESEFQ